MIYGPNGEQLSDGQGRRYPDIPLGTYFANAGLSHREAFEAAGHCQRRAKELLRRHLRNLEIEHPQRARSYASDHNMRIELNKRVIAAALLEMGFNDAELHEIDKGLGLQLRTQEKIERVAYTSGPDGPKQFRLKDLDPERENGKTILLEDLQTGKRVAH